ncbi:MAG: nicotinate (nicotinamide) nucleotide adenylyltransferase [bacterium (Candidatus Stahlbacteria) CG23_combo_of_CG06-09_8_20_14_all_34_7]|nr:MAG: nicotinate (nicotinamide) nucleotide adenylyltransferase [bacterium (Candidatus Stahlbacteria) CG23_combo_of_CG06-09_8_20_14_all_34_7]
MKIGILGGGFDPVHIGHILPLMHLLNKNIIDRAIVVPCYRQPLKDDYSTPYGVRLEMALSAFRFIPEITVSDIESKLPLPSYTIYTLRELKKNHLKDNLYFIIGEDEAEQINLWHRFEDVQDYADFIIVRRYNHQKSINLKYFGNSIFADNPIIEISSTYLRELVKNKKPIMNFTPQSVIDIIQRENLYHA